MAESEGPSTPPRKKPKRQCHFDDKWIHEFKGIGKSHRGNTFAHCSLCSSDFGISHGGRNDVTTHVKGKHHREMDAASSTTQSVRAFFRPEVQKSVSEAEARWSLYVTKHNLSFQASDHATKLFKVMFPDSNIAKKFACGHTKTSAIVTKAFAPHYEQSIIDNLSNNPFSILMDESNDSTDKSCIILVRIFDTEVGNVRTRFLDMPVVNIGTAQNIFQALKQSLQNHGLDFNNAIAFMSDTVSVMKGARSGVQKRIKNEMPHLYDVGCINHLADLTIKAGMETLPIDIDQLFVDVFYYFYHSSKRGQLFVDHWCSLFDSEPKTILKHCPTRWLSLLRCVHRFIEQLEGLTSFFLSCEEQTDKVVSISRRLQNPLTKLILHFLAFVLPSMNRFSKQFQKSTENTTCELYDEVCRLTKLYCKNLLTTEAILAAGDNLTLLNLERNSQVPDENLGIGTDTWTCLAEYEQEKDPKPFFSAIRNFYLATIKKMLKKFPFGDSILKDLGVLQPDKASSYSASTILSLAKRFPQIGLSESETLDQIEEEFNDFLLSPNDLPKPDTYHVTKTIEKPCPGPFWWKVSRIKTLSGELRFGTLCKLMFGLLAIPCSNADAERGFSILRKIHTDQRSSLSHPTIVSLMSVKFNCDSCCFDAELSQELIAKCKKAASQSIAK